jgi:hypothetical protein
MPDTTFQLKVVEFRNVIEKQGACPYELILPPDAKEVKHPDQPKKASSWKCGPKVTVHEGHYQKPEEQGKATTLRLEAEHAVVQFLIVDENGKPGSYHPVGVAFSRADNTTPIATPFTTGASALTLGSKASGNNQSPFTRMKINDPVNTLEIDCRRIKDLGSKQHGSAGRTHRTYRFHIFIQKADTGEIGVIDPEWENQN